MYQVYSIVNLINGKMYIGLTTKTLEQRFKEHCMPNRKHSRISKSIQKYGYQNFRISMIEEYASEEEMKQGEIEWIAYFNTYGTEFGYNDTKGGDFGPVMKGKKNPFYGHVWTEEELDKLRKREFSKEQRERMSIAAKNRMSKRTKGPDGRFMKEEV